MKLFCSNYTIEKIISRKNNNKKIIVPPFCCLSPPKEETLGSKWAMLFTGYKQNFEIFEFISKIGSPIMFTVELSPGKHPEKSTFPQDSCVFYQGLVPQEG